MNDLSWLILCAEIVGNIGVLFLGFGFLSFITAAVAVVAGGIMRDSSYSDSDEWARGFYIQKLGLKLGPAFGAVLLVVSCFIPSKETMYAIAASEVGESVLKSQTGGKAVKALDAWLDAQIKQEAQPEEKK